MIREYAVDPVAISNWGDFRYVIDQCGKDHGRYVSEYPKKWKKMVYAAAKRSCKAVELKRIEEKLKSMGDRVLSTTRPFVETDDWLCNAENAHAAEPFDAILSYHNPRAHPAVALVRDLVETDPLWVNQGQITVPRVAATMVQSVRPMLLRARQIILVDPHFDATEARFQNPLRSVAQEVAHRHSHITRFEYHLVGSAALTSTQFANGCNHFIRPLLPSGMQIRFVRWQSIAAYEDGSGGKRMHARYLLTDIGGVLFEWGLDEGVDGDTVHLVLLSNPVYLENWNKYQRSTSPFVFSDEVVITGSG